jgi:ATP-dependent DNA helicase RecQ
MSPEDHLLFGALRLWRAAESRAPGVPPYVIFQDVVLREIVAARPATLDALGQLRAVGASKLARYGAQVIEVTRRGG